MFGVGAASHCKFKTICVVVFATSFDTKSNNIHHRLPSTIKEDEDDDNENDAEW